MDLHVSATGVGWPASWFPKQVRVNWLGRAMPFLHKLAYSGAKTGLVKLLIVFLYPCLTYFATYLLGVRSRGRVFLGSHWLTQPGRARLTACLLFSDAGIILTICERREDDSISTFPQISHGLVVVKSCKALHEAVHTP